MYTYIPQKNVKKITSIVFLLAIGAAAIFLFSCLPLNIPFSWTFQLVATIMLVAIIYLTTRYVVKGYEYRVAPKDDGEGSYLTITEISGKTRITVCRIGLENVSAVMRIEASNVLDIKKTIKDEHRKKFNYTVEDVSSIKCCIFAEECGEPIAVTISSDEALFELLGQLVFEGFADGEFFEGEWEDSQ